MNIQIYVHVYMAIQSNPVRIAYNNPRAILIYKYIRFRSSTWQCTIILLRRHKTPIDSNLLAQIHALFCMCVENTQ